MFQELIQLLGIKKTL